MLELAIVIPTLNERENIAPLIARLEAMMGDIDYEIVIVDDDSPDGTAECARAISLYNPRVRVIQRLHRRGLSSASMEGMLATAAPYIAVMDGDLQHDESILPQMYHKVRDDHLDLVVGSRHVGEGSVGDFSRERQTLSALGRRLSHLVTRCEIQDPMSGFFVVDRRFLETAMRSVSGIGFKILVDLLAASPRPVRLAEVPYRFRTRQWGESKLDIVVAIEYLQLLLDKLLGDLIPPRYILFAMVGSVGVILHLALMKLLISPFHVPILTAQLDATVVVMTLNFLLNNSFTYRDLRLRGRKLLVGLLGFYAACAIGLGINIEVADLVEQLGFPWYAVGLAGLVVSSVWNFGVTNAFVWRVRRRRARTRGLEALATCHPIPAPASGQAP